MSTVFEYQALDGGGRIMSGRVTAVHERDALRQLQGQGLLPTSLITAPSAAAVTARAAGRARAIVFQDYILTLKQLALLLNAAVPLVQAVATLKDQGIHPGLSRAFADIEKRIRAGDPFSAAFTGALPNLPAYVAQLVAAGEAIGRLGPAIADAVKQMEYDHQVRVEIRNALTYPAVLVTAGLAAVLFIFIVVVPRFSAMMSSTNADVPLLSRLVLKTGLFLNEHAMAIAVVAAVLATAGAWLFRDPAMRVRAREALARAPLVGTWLRESDLAGWASLLSTMLGNGIDLIRALGLARDSVRVPSLARNLDQVTKAVRGGAALSAALARQGTFNQTAVSLIEVGEDSGELPAMLRSLATLYEDAGRQRMKRFLLLLEPAAIILIGGVIGGIVVAIMLAITSVNQLAI
ncbi:MAG: type II secretion system F family protein [Rhodospirillaceae bacterium]|nr:type II secretion system F family protein [Rhodospirillaceae bacterium]